MRNIDRIVNPYTSAPEDRIDRELLEQYCTLLENEIPWDLVKAATLTGSVPNLPGGVYMDTSRTWALVIGANQESLPEYLAQFGTELTELSVCCTDISRFSVGSLKGLHDLTLRCNPKLELINGLEHLEMLESLFLSQTALRHLPEAIRGLRKLKRLILSRMELDALPHWLPELMLPFHKSWGDGICFPNTTIKGVDMSIFDQPQDVILKWFESRKTDAAVPLREVKVIFLGDGEAGKTHTIARLLNDGLEPRPEDFDDKATPGIVIKDKHYEMEGQDVNVHYWDFGGQEILHSMHRMFLTERTLYVVLINARDDTQDDRARYWLHNIRSFAKDAPVLLVLNKIDQNPKASVNETELREFYSGLRQVVRLSAKEYSPEQFNAALTDALMEEIRNLDTIGTLWPASWAKLKQGLQNMKTNFIKGAEYKQICIDSGVGKNQEELLHWFNDLGISLSYQGSRRLENYVILRPDWITNGIYTLLYNKSDETVNGVIPMRVIYDMLNPQSDRTYRRNMDITYDVEETQFVLEVMRKFYLSYPISPEAEFIPALCQRDSMPIAKEYAGDENTLEFRMTYDYLPDNVIHRLMVEMRQDLQHSNVWRTGALFCQPGTGLSAVVKSEGDVLRIFVRTENPMHRPNTYLSILKENIERINRDMKLEEPYAEVVYKYAGGSECFDYQDLLATLADGEESYRSKRLRRRIPIMDILNQTGFEAEQDLKKLREDILTACMQLQGNKTFWGAKEDVCNTYLRDALRNMGHLVNDQTFQGAGGSGKSFGELDLDIRQEPNVLWTILEALRITGGYKTTDWNRHLEKLLNKHNPSGLRHLFLLTYVDCERDDFAALMDKYTEHVRWYDPGHCQRLPGTFSPLHLQRFGNPSDLRVMQCSYDVGGAVVTVYFYFVCMAPGFGHASAPPLNLPAETTPVSENASGLSDNPQESPAQPAETNAPSVQDEDQPILSEYRVVILGDSEAGKSHILARLKNPELPHTAFLHHTAAKPQKEACLFSGDATDGIAIAGMTYTIDNRKVHVNYWDFGGQEILHSLQRLFLAQQSLYVIVLNTRNDNQDNQADFWLRYVQTYAPGAPVILVLNKIDQNPHASLNMSMLKRRFGNGDHILDVLRISARDDSREQFQINFIDRLTAHIGRCLNSDCSFTAQQIRIRDRLSKRRAEQQLIESNTFHTICKEEGMNDRAQCNALRKRFKRAGILVYFQTKTKILLDPEWITKAIFSILKSRDQRTANGILSTEELEELLLTDSNTGYCDEHIDFIQRVMRETGLSFPYQYSLPGDDEKQSADFIPMLCRREEPPEIETMEPEREPVELQMHYDYLPPSVIHQLMVERHKELDKEKAWLNGAVFLGDHGCTAVVRRDVNILTILVWGDDPAYSIEYMGNLKRDIARIALSDLHNAIAREVRIGYSLNGTTEYFNYNRLNNAKACNIPYTASNRAHRRIAILDILEQSDRSEARALELLLQTTLAGCMELQDDQTFWFRSKTLKELEKHLPKMDENARNRQLRRTLSSRFIVKDQTQSAESASGRSPSELDLAIFTKPDIHWSILEALNISGINRDSEERWLEHLHRMMEHYNKKGLRHLLLVSYLNCPDAKFDQIDAHYSDLLRSFTPDGLGCKQELFEPVSIQECPEAIRISRADYSGGRGKVSIFHFLVHIPEISVPEAAPTGD